MRIQIICPHTREFQSYEIPPDGRLVVGRGNVDIVVVDPACSRNHALIFRNNGNRSQVFVKDLNSANGTYVNGERITEPSIVGEGDEMRVGNVLIKLLCESPLEDPSPKPFGFFQGLTDPAG